MREGQERRGAAGRDGPWIAFEYVKGVPLNWLLEQKKQTGRALFIRHKYEVAYQVWAGGSQRTGQVATGM